MSSNILVLLVITSLYIKRLKVWTFNYFPLVGIAVYILSSNNLRCLLIKKQNKLTPAHSFNFLCITIIYIPNIAKRIPLCGLAAYLIFFVVSVRLYRLTGDVFQFNDNYFSRLGRVYDREILTVLLVGKIHSRILLAFFNVRTLMLSCGRVKICDNMLLSFNHWGTRLYNDQQTVLPQNCL